MGMFGSALKKIATPENLYLLGATLKDIGDPGADNFSQAQASMAARQAKAQKAEMVSQLGGLFGGQAAAQGIVGAGYGSAGNPGHGMGSGIDLRSPQAQALLFRAQQMGIDVGPLIQMYSATKPDIAFSPDGEAINKADPANLGRRFANRSNVNGTVIDMNDPNNTNRAVPEAPVKGAMPVYDNMGRVTDWSLPQGAQGAMQAASQAEQLGKTRGGLISVPWDDGSTAMMTGDQFLSRGQGRIPGLGRTQTPAQAAAASIEAKAGAESRVNLAGAVDNSNATLDVIDKLIKHPALKMRTGMFGMVPAVPGTPGVSFDAMRDQLKGKMFLEAFSSLKGGGAISEVEGTKATNAMAALNTAQTTEDFVSALNDLKSVIEKGKERAAAQAGRGPSPGGSERPSPPTPGAVVKGYRYLGGDPGSPRSWQRAQ